MNYYNFIFTVASGKVKSQVIWNHSLSRLYVLLIYYELKVTPLLPAGSIAQSMTPWFYPKPNNKQRKPGPSQRIAQWSRGQAKELSY